MADDRLQLYSYWRSSAAYRVRIGLNLKGLEYEIRPIHLVRDGGEQHAPEYAALNPQEMLPILRHGERVVRQSLAILEYLDEAFADGRLLPMTARDRARVRALAHVVASDIHPLNNLRVLQYFEHTWHVPHSERDEWIRHWITEGLSAMEQLMKEDPMTGTYSHGESPTLADCCLVPQLYNARRFAVDLAPYPTLVRIDEACRLLPAFEHARPENQPDAPSDA